MLAALRNCEGILGRIPFRLETTSDKSLEEILDRMRDWSEGQLGADVGTVPHQHFFAASATRATAFLQR